MARKIKFKAQRSDTLEWVYFTLGDLVCNKTNEPQFREAKVEWLNWCEFTGLLDKNGKEIYEGDIISPCGCNYYDHKVKVVQYEQGKFNLNYHGYKDHDWEVKVIGNIYEHGHLLDNK